jgi:hypothetical protein
MVETHLNKPTSGLKNDLLLNQSASTTTTMKPVLEKVEKIVHKDIVERPHIVEEHKKDFIEIHEQPIQKRILHPEQQVFVKEQSVFETSGQQFLPEKQRLLEEMRLKDSNRPVMVEEREDLTVHANAPTVDIQRDVRKELIQKPVVTEIHEQPITEIHERNIHKTVFEQPSVTVVRDAPIVETTSMSSQPLLSGTTLHHQQPLPSTGFVQQQPLQSTGFTETTSTGSTGSGIGQKIKNKIKSKLSSGSTTGTTGQTWSQPQQTGFVQQQPLQQPLQSTGQTWSQPQQTGFVQQPPLQSTWSQPQQTGFIQQQPLQQPFVQQQPILGSTAVVEKGVADPLPHLTNNSGINPTTGTRKF